MHVPPHGRLQISPVLIFWADMRMRVWSTREGAAAAKPPVICTVYAKDMYERIDNLVQRRAVQDGGSA